MPFTNAGRLSSTNAAWPTVAADRCSVQVRVSDSVSFLLLFSSAYKTAGLPPDERCTSDRPHADLIYVPLRRLSIAAMPERGSHTCLCQLSRHLCSTISPHLSRNSVTPSDIRMLSTNRAVQISTRVSKECLSSLNHKQGREQCGVQHVVVLRKIPICKSTFRRIINST